MGRPIDEAVNAMRSWGESRAWRGYDPYDALNSPATPVLTLGTAIGRRLLTQLVKLSPVNLRPPLQIESAHNAKAIALVASGYAWLSIRADEEAGASARHWLSWLERNHNGGSDGIAWGYHFDVQTRVCFYPRGTPNTIATSFAVGALLDGVELLGDERWLETAVAACDYLVAHLLVEGSGGPYFRYVGAEDVLIHNANMLASAALARAGRLSGRTDLADVAARACRTTVSAQRPDGSWPYGRPKSLSWVDNFHTGYVLESLAECVRVVPDLHEQLRCGVAQWEQDLFLRDGTPKYMTGNLYPIDAHCYATAIDTWLGQMHWHPKAVERAQHLAVLEIERMLDSKGYIHFQQRRFWKNRLPFVRWTTAPSFRALSRLLAALEKRSVAYAVTESAGTR